MCVSRKRFRKLTESVMTAVIDRQGGGAVEPRVRSTEIINFIQEVNNTTTVSGGAAESRNLGVEAWSPEITDFP